MNGQTGLVLPTVGLPGRSAAWPLQHPARQSLLGHPPWTPRGTARRFVSPADAGALHRAPPREGIWALGLTSDVCRAHARKWCLPHVFFILCHLRHTCEAQHLRPSVLEPSPFCAKRGIAPALRPQLQGPARFSERLCPSRRLLKAHGDRRPRSALPMHSRSQHRDVNCSSHRCARMISQSMSQTLTTHSAQRMSGVWRCSSSVLGTQTTGKARLNPYWGRSSSVPSIPR